MVRGLRNAIADWGLRNEELRKTEVRSQKPEVGSQKSEVRSQEP